MPKTKLGIVIPLCDAEPLCMEVASHQMRIVIGHRDGVAKPREQNFAVCPRHKRVLEEHAAKRAGENPNLTIDLSSVDLDHRP